MPSFDLILKTGLFLILLFFGTHYIRTWAFSRYEAVTFECSSAAFLISLLIILRYGYSKPLGLLAAALLVAFIANALTQWHFYMVLQGIIQEAFSRKAEYLKKQAKASFINEMLLTMASVAIMPSFSRFIEESKLFNNPGSFIGLIKSLLKRQRFQKKKYLMRECFADNINMIGPCKPGINSMMKDRNPVIPDPVHANDLALKKKHEITGLITFDVLGFGALAAVWIFLAAAHAPAAPAAAGETGALNAVLVLLVLILCTCLSHFLRHLAFARYESFGYELSFSALVAVSFGIFEDLVSLGRASWPAWLAFGLVLLLFIAASFVNRRTDKTLHKEINEKIENNILRLITPATETDRTKRRFLRNMKTIIEWAVVPFPNGGRIISVLMALMPGRKMAAFEETNRKKQEMPDLMEKLIDSIVPEHAHILSPDDFRVPAGKLLCSKWIINAAGLLGIGIIVFCIWTGIF